MERWVTHFPNTGRVVADAVFAAVHPPRSQLRHIPPPLSIRYDSLNVGAVPSHLRPRPTS